MPYASASDVAPLCQNILSASPNFTANTKPASATVDVWLSSGSAIINTRLASKGYSPIPESSEAYGLAKAANGFYGAWLAQRGLLNQRSSADENDLAEQYKKDFEFHLDMLMELDLSMAGVPSTNKRTPYAGGISVADKSRQNADADRVKPRFERGQFRNPEGADAGSSGS